VQRQWPSTVDGHNDLSGWVAALRLQQNARGLSPFYLLYQMLQRNWLRDTGPNIKQAQFGDTQIFDIVEM
jgi:hypothetical protein